MTQADSAEQAISALERLGLTNLEARIYAFLSQQSPATGYRIAKEVGKPTANVYKAVEALKNKGAILVDHGTVQLCRAVQYEEFLLQMERQFTQQRKRAHVALEELQSAAGVDDRVYQLHDPAQVFERARSMIERTKRIVIVDADPGPLAALVPDLEDAARRTRVLVKAYEEIAIEGAEVMLDRRASSFGATPGYPGQWLNVVVDADEHLLSLFDWELSTVHQAIWSQSVCLSFLYYGGISCEVAFVDLLQRLEAGDTTDQLRHRAKRYLDLWDGDLPGYRALRRRFG